MRLEDSECPECQRLLRARVNRWTKGSLLGRMGTEDFLNCSCACIYCKKITDHIRFAHPELYVVLSLGDERFQQRVRILEG